MGDPDLVRLDVHAQPCIEGELRKRVAADREGSVRRFDIEVGDTDSRFHPSRVGRPN